jgi:hypothetical protein
MTMEHLETLIAFAVVMLGVSLLITVFTQMVSALFGLRGTNLLWGLKTLFAAFDQRIVDQAEAVLRRPLISDSVFSRWRNAPLVGKLIARWTLSSALRPDELIRALIRISAELKASGKAGDATTAAAIDKALAEIDPEVGRQVQLLKTAVQAVAPGAAQQLDQRAQDLVESASKSVGRLETLFDTAMSRVSARFGLHMRIWTVAFAGLIAFTIHLDSLQLLQQLYSNPQMRSSLVTSSDAMIKEAGTVIAAPAAGAEASAATVEPQAYSAAVTALQAKEKEATQSITMIPASFESLDAAVNWLKPQLAGDDNARNKLIQEYRVLVSTELMKRANAIRGLLASSGFQLIPNPYPGFFNYGGKRNVLGIIASWALLSLGAPFWFNALKSLSNLRPVLAGAGQPSKDQAPAA